MWVKVTVTFSLKDRPKGYRGPTSYTIATVEQTSLYNLVKGIVEQAAEFYGLVYPADQLNANMDDLAEWAKASRFDDEKQTGGESETGPPS